MAWPPRPSDTGAEAMISKSFARSYLRSRFSGHERCLNIGPDCPQCEETSVNTKPASLQSEAHGIVIQSAAPQPKPVRFWAYLWAADDDVANQQHWHERVPTEHAA